eukprot:CAMPEP_0206234770 /NCGR_PEP_ID=MMETSP0047_2-20121206/12770_1 /ASSEMBLY_ACC=CAM_ASM_000192 /TAXON_ID=195065 /ORGANISM="Chroomonas mesostigmatica_cf, Strain CCMP1168" /LENGTH=654 /DNA_ID=CAMNT_0053658883 /DNA_START=38 /DNA_END=1999 /DNA_ORIENTATION=-
MDSPLMRFRQAAAKAKAKPRKLAASGFVFDKDQEPEVATRWKFDVRKNDFVKDSVQVLMQKQTMVTDLPGATRELYRCKVVSKLRGTDAYVAKAYKQNVKIERQIYYIDCKMQILAKQMADEFNRLKPPHRIDFLECFVLEFQGREGTSLYAAEKFIEGHYEKHSSNNGFIEEAHYRITPHAFSHFTYVMSGGKRIIVDLQGVGDLWTDPQIHCTTNEDFGIGNTGIVGMAKFFRTYRYNPLSEWLGLTPFKQSPYDADKHKDMDWEKLTHDWSLSDLAKKPNPQRDSIRKFSRKLGGDVHFQMAKMFETGAFGDQPDKKSAVFHMECSAELGFPLANITLAKCYAGIPRDVLKDLSPEENHAKAFAFWKAAAKHGDPTAMYYVAQYYEGLLTAEGVKIDWPEAVRWYETLIEAHHALSDEEHEDEDCPFEMHKIYAKIAHLYAIGEHGLRRRPARSAEYYTHAAEEAENLMKAKMAAKYYEKAEELGSEEDDDDTLSISSSQMGSQIDVMFHSFNLDTPTPASPGGHGLLRQNTEDNFHFRVDPAIALAHTDKNGSADSAGVQSFIRTFSQDSDDPQAGTTVSVRPEELARMGAFIKSYQAFQAKLAQLSNDRHRMWMVRCVYNQGRLHSEPLRASHQEYLETHTPQVQIAGR